MIISIKLTGISTTSHSYLACMGVHVYIHTCVYVVRTPEIHITVLCNRLPCHTTASSSHSYRLAASLQSPHASALGQPCYSLINLRNFQILHVSETMYVSIFFSFSIISLRFLICHGISFKWTNKSIR